MYDPPEGAATRRLALDAVRLRWLPSQRVPPIRKRRPMRTGGILTLVIAHRGASADAPENSLAAFRLALDEGADGVESSLCGRPAAVASMAEARRQGEHLR